MDNATKLKRRKYTTTNLSAWTFNKEECKAFHGEMIEDAQGNAVERCLEDFVPEYTFNFYYWVVAPPYDSCVALLKSMQFDEDTHPKLIKVYDNPDYQ